MIAIDIIFWLSLTCIAYTFVGYPVLAAARAKLRSRPVRKDTYRGSFTIVLAAYNEEQTIGRRLDELTRLIAGTAGDIIIVTDGCNDRTAAIAQEYERDHEVRVIALLENRGKAAALNEAVAQAGGDVILFADARQSWDERTIPTLLANFADSDVGAVSGDLKLESSPGVLAGVGLYWRFEKWLRRAESRTWSQVGVTGAISGVRRALFSPIPAGTLLDDVYWPLKVAMAGHRVIHDDAANAFDRLPDQSSKEFRRKVRTLAGNFQLVGLVPGSLLPWKNPVWLAWMSHKLMRLVAPWALIGLFVTSALMDNPEAWGFFGLQAVCYAAAIAGLMPGLNRSRWLGAAASFLVLNAAAWVAFWVWITGRTGSAWRKTEYAVKEQTCETVA